MKKLGFGFMRLPKNGDSIDIEQTIEMVDLFINAGFTYFDTAWTYEGSEEAIRSALVERYPRDKYVLATKMAAWANCNSREDAISQFECSLKRTGAEYFDYYLFHNLGENRTKIYDDYNLWDWALQQKKKGLIKHLGFSFHSTPQELEAILRAHPETDFVQLQINYADWDNYHIQSRGVYEVARKYRKPIIVMEPVKGGMLAAPPKEVADLFKTVEPNSSGASWALRFVANLDGVITVLSGMSTIDQMRENLLVMSNFQGLSEEQKKVIGEAQTIIRDLPMIPCTLCNYCAKVCPMNIGISGTFTAANYLMLYRDEKIILPRHRINNLVDKQGKVNASECIKCGKCELVCPQHIEIRKELERAIEVLTTCQNPI